MRKEIVAMLLFGSIWGLMECSLGDYLHKIDFFAGIIMTSIAFILMAYTRYIYNIRGMQVVMAGIAAIMRHFNPVGGCLLCASIAIFIEGIAFELIWLLPWQNEKSKIIKFGIGAISGYSLYAIGFISTQIITPMITAKFYMSDLMANLPSILSKATYALIIGAIVLPIIMVIPKEMKIKSKLYYTASVAITAICWIAVFSGI